MQVAIQDGAGNYWGGATFNQGSIFYNATGGTVAAWTYSHRDARRPAHRRPHLHDHRQARPTPPATPAPTTRTFVYDTTAPTVTNVTSTKADGTYPAGTSIPVTVTFSENVTVTGSPTLALNSGGTATYSSGSGSATLTFAYTTAGGENTADLDYSATNSLALSGGTIKDAATNNATLTLPDGRRRELDRRPEGDRRRHRQPDRVASRPRPSNGTPTTRRPSRPTSPAPPPTPAAPARVSSVQVAIQDGAGNYWGGATFNQGSIFYNATGGTVGAWTYSHRHPRRPAHRRPHLHDHRQARPTPPATPAPPRAPSSTTRPRRP